MKHLILITILALTSACAEPKKDTESKSSVPTYEQMAYCGELKGCRTQCQLTLAEYGPGDVTEEAFIQRCHVQWVYVYAYNPEGNP